MQPSLLVTTLLMIAAAQAPRPVFEAASVKPNTAQSPLVRVSTFPNRFSAVNATVRMLVRYAYSLPDYRIAGGPNWIDADRFDIEATAGSSGGSFDAVRAMTRALLEDRFKFRARMETRDQAIYELTVVRRDGKLGQQIKPSGSDCLPITPPPGAPPPP